MANRLFTLTVVVALNLMAEVPLQGQSTFKEPSREFAVQTDRLLLDKKYAELETTATRLRRERPMFASGRLQLLDFYEALSNVRGEDGLRDLRRADDRVQQLEAWHTAQPTITSRVSLAGCLVESAWAARGSGFADTISPEGFRKMSSALERADGLLAEADRELRRDNLNDPFLYYTWMRVGVLKGFERPRMRELLNRALEGDPWFMPAVDEMCLYVLPRWYGGEGDLLRLADELTQQTRAQTGETVYAIVALNALTYGEIHEFSANGFGWPRVRQGLHDWLRSAPDSTYRLGTLARLAHIANDRDTARDALDRLHGRWNTGVFPRRINFLRTERWAREEPVDSEAALIVEFGPIAILDVAFVEEGRVFVVGTRERALQLRSAFDGALLQEIPLESGRAELLATDPAGRFVVFTSPKRKVTRVSILDLVSREQVELGTQAGRIRALAASADQQFVVMSNDQGQLRRWEFGVRPIPLEWASRHTDRFVTGVALAPDGKRLASAGGTQVKLWNLSSSDFLN